MPVPKQLLVFLAIISLAAVNLTGCCGSSCDKPGDKNKAAPAKTDAEGQKDARGVPSDAAKLSGPAAATYAFLDAARRGDDEKTTAMLTPTARKEIAKLGLNVGPKCSDTAKIYIGEVKSVSDQLAHVASRLTDVGAKGTSKSYEQTWILRHVDEGWRVGGMATVVFEGEPPLLLNFEKPQEMLQKDKMLREEVARRAGKTR